MALAIDWEFVARFAVAVGVGGLIGLERERHHDEAKIMAGVRTLPLVSLSGALAVATSERLGEPLVVAGAVLVFGALSLLIARSRDQFPAAGLTSPVTFFATFFLGVLAGLGSLVLAIAIAVAITLLLVNKRLLHTFAEVLTTSELHSAIGFVVFAFLLYPVAPAAPIDPWGLFVPRDVLLIVILVSAFSFLGFVALRRLGPARGLSVAGFLGGIANSTAATMSLASLPLRDEGQRDAATTGVLLAGAAMLIRNLAIAILADPTLRLARLVALPLALLVAVLFLFARPLNVHDKDTTRLEMASPFALRPALRFGLVFVALTVLAHSLAGAPVGPAGLYLTAAGAVVSGGAVVASMALLVSQGSVDAATAGSVVLLAVAISALMKLVVVRTGARLDWRRFVAPFGAVAGLAGAAALWFGL